MSPGIDDHPHMTGALPKSNRRSDRNRTRERSAVNRNTNCFGRSHGAPAAPQHANNLFQFDWHPVSERQPRTTTTTTTAATGSRSAKNSNTRSAYDANPYEFGDIGSYNSHSRLYPNTYSRDAPAPWLKMSPPVDPRTQSPPNLSAKPTNTDKMPDRGQVEGRLNQIREYIKVTSTMMDSLSQSSDPRAQAQREKLGRMVEDLYDSETKLSKLMEDCQKYWRSDENGELENGGEDLREQELRKKVEESQRKLAQLQEHQSHLMGMQLRVRERLNEARQAQRALLDEDDNEENGHIEPEEGNEEQQMNGRPTASNVEQLERETEVLRGKLQQLESKKRHMDHLVQELQAVEQIERASCSSDSSRTVGQRDKVADLEAMKAQLAHLKSLMNEATRSRESAPDTQVVSEPEHDDENDDHPLNTETQGAEGIFQQVEENGTSIYSNSFNDVDETNIRSKLNGNPPSVEQIQAVTRELKEQQLLLQAARAELQHLKQTGSSNPIQSSTPPPSLLTEKKLSNHSSSNNDARFAQNKRFQLEDFMRKDQSHGSSINQNGGLEWSSRRGSNSQHSHTSTPGNLWPPPTNLVNGSQDHSVDGISAAENLLEMGSQPTIENGFGVNFWSMPSMLANQPPQAAGATVGTAEYYRQLLLGSQAQQLQMMSTTLQQCCQLLWAQQREMQSMRSAITQLQAQVRHSQTRMSNNLENLEEQHSNLSRATTQAHFSSALDAAMLPPSSSLPNLVSLPNSSSPAPPTVMAAQASCQQPPPQLNNQVPPGNRANNYWDNFRSYSRQNLLSGSSKTVTDYTVSTSTHAVSSTNTANGVIISSQVNNKCNRQHGLESIPGPSSVSASDAQYSLNLQQQLQQSDSIPRNNYSLSNDGLSQQLLQHQQQQSTEDTSVQPSTSFRRGSGRRNDESCARIAKSITELISSRSEDLRSILMHCLKALESQQRQNESPLPSSNISNSSESSDDESEAGARGSSRIPNVGNVNSGNHQPTVDTTDRESSAQALHFSPQPPFCFLQDSYVVESSVINSANLTLSSDSNEDLIEAHRSRHELSNNIEQVFGNEENVNSELDGAGNGEAAAASGSVDQSSTNCIFENTRLSLEELNTEDERERAEYVMLDRSHNSPTIQWSQAVQQKQNRRSRSQVIDKPSHSS